MPSTNTSASIAMPSRADEPINTISYYNIIPLEQSDPEHLLCLAIEGNGFEEGQRVILSTQLANGGAHFRLDGSGRWGSYLRSRNSGKMLVPANGYALQMALKDEEAAEAELDLVPAGQHLYRICQKARPHIQARIGSATAGAPLEFTDAAPGTLFYLAPATRFEWIDEGESGARNYQDSTELSLRAAIDGVLGFGGDKISEFTEIPGGAMILQMILPLIWPEKSLNEILEEFRKDLLEDMRRLMASEALVQATNTLLDTRRKYLMQYLDERRMKIDRPSNGLDQVAGSYADTFSQAILRLLPGIIGADGKINPLIAPEYIPLAKAGLNVYMQGAADHICALQERALMAAFNPANVSRFYPRSADRRFLEAGSSDRVRLEAQAPSRQKTLSLVNLVDDTLSHGDQVALKVSNGQYLSAFFGNMGPITAIRKTRGEWETFRIERRAGPGRIQAGDSIVLLCCQGFCVSATNGGGAGLIA